MNSAQHAGIRSRFLKRFTSGVALVLLTVSLPVELSGAEESLSQKAKDIGIETKAAVTDAVEDAKNAVGDAGRTAGKALENLWNSIDQQRLKNRTPDQIIAWLIMGVLVGAVAGMATSLKTSGWGKVGRLLLGLAGAFLGGIVVQATRIDFGWGPVLIRYEELLFAFLGALLLVVIGRLVRSRSKRQPARE